MEKASDRRASVRRPIRLAATLDIEAAGQRWPCQIADFCAEGLFVRFSVATSQQIMPYFAAGSPTVQVTFRQADGRHSHTLEAQPVRRIEGALGLEFSGSNPAAITALLALCGEDKSGLAATGGVAADRADFLLRQCARETIKFVEPLLLGWFTAVEKALQEAAQQAISDQHGHDFMDAAIKIRTHQQPFWHMMSQIMEGPLRPSAEGPGKVQLGLVDKGEFEDWLLLRVMVTKAETQFRDPLLQLRMRLDKAGFVLASGHQNPLGPILVCDAFRQALEHLDCSRAVDKLAYRVFDKNVVRHLEALYVQINAILIRQGILPDLDLSKYLVDRKPAPQMPAPNKPAPTKANLNETGASEQPKTAANAAWAARGSRRQIAGQFDQNSAAAFNQSLNSAQSAFATVGKLLDTLRQSRAANAEPVAPAAESATSPLSLPELQQYLGDSGLVAEAASGDAVTASLRQRVIQRVETLEGRRLDPEQEKTVDVVDRFFTSLEQSPKLNAASRQQLQQLGIPVLRAVLQERRFFEEEDSPVRGVLNRVAQLGVRGGRPNPVVQRKIDGVISRISQGFDEDGAVFHSALTELDELVARQNLAYRRNVERVTAAAEGAQKVDLAKKAVSATLDAKLAGQQVPRVLVSLLNGGWRDLLSLTYVRQGPDSGSWRDYLGVLDGLLAFSRDPDTELNLPELLRLIQEGLAMVSSNQVPAGQIRDELKGFLTRRSKAASELIEMPAVVDRRGDLTDISESRQKSLQRWLRRAQGLQVGEWMKFQEDPDNPSYMRLVWIGSGFSRFVFVNHQGMKVVELDPLRLASHLQKGIVVSDPGYERPIVDESIDRMIQQVYEQTSQASTCDELTGVLARREFERVLGQWLAASASRNAARSTEQQVLAVLELQQFREISDAAGFKAGDDALRQVANLLRTLAAAETAHLARLGGTRFGLLLNASSAEVQAKRIIGAIEGLTLTFNGKVYPLTVNMGLAIDQPGLATAERWLAATEDVLVGARRDGVRRPVWYAPEPGEAAEQARIASKVAAIENLDQERVLLRCQKIIPLHGATMIGTQHQVLFSVYDDHGQLIQGTEFMRMAEHQGRAQTTDLWMVGHMLGWLGRNPKALQKLGSVGISLSGRSLGNAGLLEFIFDRMSQKDAPIEGLWFDITEAAAIDNLDHAVEFMTEMRELGCGFCLSGFGGRGQSYEALKRLPVDRIKLDHTFLDALPGNESDQAMVRSMTEMAHFLGREVIAGPVESTAMLDLLRTLGVDYAQGSAIEKPGPLEA